MRCLRIGPGRLCTRITAYHVRTRRFLTPMRREIWALSQRRQDQPIVGGQILGVCARNAMQSINHLCCKDLGHTMGCAAPTEQRNRPPSARPLRSPEHVTRWRNLTSTAVDSCSVESHAHALWTWTPDPSTGLLRPARQPAHRHVLCKAIQR